MAEKMDEWATKGVKNMFGQVVKVQEMQAEGGAAGAVRGGLRVPQRAAGDRLGPNRGNAAEGRRAGMRLYMCACERCGKEVPATLAGYAKMVLRNSARIDGKARALCPECAESLRAWFLAGAVKPEGRE